MSEEGEMRRSARPGRGATVLHSGAKCEGRRSCHSQSISAPSATLNTSTATNFVRRLTHQVSGFDRSRSASCHPICCSEARTVCESAGNATPCGMRWCRTRR